MPKTKRSAGPSLTVEMFLKAGSEALNMELVTGRAGLNRQIVEGAINRPGLALSGFYQYFAHRRVQVMGLAEHCYLQSLAPAEREHRLDEFFSRKIPCVVVTRNMNVCPITRRLSEERGVAVLRTKLITKHFINAATIIMENLMAPHMHVQGTMVEIMGMGVLIEGAPGMGKSETALALIKKGHALVSDDVTALRRDSAGAIVAAPTDVTRYHMEIRGVGIIHVPSLFGVASVREEKKLDVVATLVHPGSTGDEDRGGGMRTTREFLGVTIPQVLVRVAPGRDIANVIEAAALDLKLRRLGHDAAKELDEHLIELLKGGGRNVSE